MLSTIRMTCDAVRGVPGHVMVLFIHFGLVVAGGTGPRRSVSAGVTLAADAVRTLMINREGMRERCILP